MESDSYRTEDFAATIFLKDIFSRDREFNLIKETSKSIIDLGLKVLDINKNGKIADDCSRIGFF